MTIEHITVNSTREMRALGKQLAERVKNGGVIYLIGPLGAGKTTIVRGFLKALGYTGIVHSPTYTLVEGYELAGKTVYHFDLYRLNSLRELENIGFRDYFSPQTICLIEWPERAQGLLPAADISCTIAMKGIARTVRLLSSRT